MPTSAELTIARRIECEEDGLYFARYFFKQRMGTKMLIGQHHPVIQRALDRTMLPPDHPDFIPRLIINVPPGYTKTELCSINYMSRGLAINPASRFLHLSYSDQLVALNSSVTRSIVKMPEYQAMWPVQCRDDMDSKHTWHTDEGGGVTARPAGGQVTGFRAGHMDETQFTGAILIDDPVKPGDSHSETIRQAVNNQYNETIASRVQVETVPIIVVMQRVDYNDLSGYLLRGGSGEKWHHLNLPVYIDNSDPYPEENTHGIPIDHGLPDGWLWPAKHNEQHEQALRAHRRRYNAQYLQKPPKRDEETALWVDSVITKARAITYNRDPIRTVIAIDPATTDTETSDEHGIIAASEYDYGDHRRFSVDGDYSRKGSPMTWAQAAIQMYGDFDADCIIIETNQGGDMCESTLRNAGYAGRVIRVHAKKGKRLRAEPVVGLYELGLVQHKPGLVKCEEEMLDFDPVTQKSNGKSPNRVDAAVYALTELSGVGDDLGQLLDMAMGSN